MEHDQPGWLAYAEAEWGFGRVTVDGATSLLFEFVRSADGSVADSVCLSNNRAGARACRRGGPETLTLEPSPARRRSARPCGAGRAGAPSGAGPQEAAAAEAASAWLAREGGERRRGGRAGRVGRPGRRSGAAGRGRPAAQVQSWGLKRPGHGVLPVPGAARMEAGRSGAGADVL